MLLWCPCCRYSSYGRHFTKEEKLKIVARKLATFLENGDLVRGQPVAASCMTACLHLCTQQAWGTARQGGRLSDVDTLRKLALLLEVQTWTSQKTASRQDFGATSLSRVPAVPQPD